MEEEDDDWVMVGRQREKDLWKPSKYVEGMFESNKALKVRFNEPAQYWTDALPLGNGRLGAMVWGAVLSETINLNEDTLWTGNPGTYTDSNAPEVVSEVRGLVDAGKYAEATTAAAPLLGKPTEVYQLVGDLKMDFDDTHAAYNEATYQRELDLDAATVKVQYSVGDVNFIREHFISNPDQVFVTKVSGSKSGSLSFTVYLDSMLNHELLVSSQNQIIMKGSCPGQRSPSKLNEDPQGIRFSAILDVQISSGAGKIYALDDQKLKVEGADWAVILLAASSSFSGPFTKASDSKKDPTLESLRTINLISNFSYTELFARHLDDYQSLFHRVSLQLSKGSKTVAKDGPLVTDIYLNDSEEDKVSTAERVKNFQFDEDPSLVELIFQYGRYLLISCSRPGTQAANLQGIWNSNLQPPWDCAPHLNINLQMNYWLSLPCNLNECQEPLFDYMSSLSINGSKTAKVDYEAKGWVAHQVSDIWAKTSRDRGKVVWSLWPMGGAWLCTHLWEHYTFTMDKDFLEKVYSLLEGCVCFLLDWLIEGRGTYLETNPSTSPEHPFIAPDGQPASVSYSTTMDMAIIREVFSAFVSAAKILGRCEDDLVEKVLKTQPQLPPTKIARDGSIMEWALNFQDPKVSHRHLSHLFGLFPGHSITVEKNPDLCKAAENSIYKRGEDGPGWSTMWKAALWARLHNSEHAYRMVKHLIQLRYPTASNFEGGLYSNLFGAHPPFQIDANFGFPAAVSEMLVQSTVQDLHLLPALPRDKWPNGSIRGLKARGGLTVNIYWGEGNLREVGLWTNHSNCTTRLHYRGTTVTIMLSRSRVYTFNSQLKCIKTYAL
ncbi:alpha-L-fucosidase 2-like [Apium graveolens]|uniref:alpha-L-fucosidase 2-like n=1 Tax=Apium graveolens TaxID=4045 RepID=UPI003D79238E